MSTILIFTCIFNITTLLFIAGIYLILAGAMSLTKNFDVLVGFLWVIDLGVGLIFFIFILHFSSFMHQKSTFITSTKHLLYVSIPLMFSFIHLYFYTKNIDFYLNTDLKRTWFFFITYSNFYTTLFSKESNVLLMLKYLYFLSNSFEFFVINYALFFGLISVILACFLIKRFYTKILFSQIVESEALLNNNSGFFIRNQNFYYQQNTQHSLRVWSKIKNV